MLTVKPIIRRRGNTISATVTIPPALIRRYDIQDNEEIVIAFLCKASEDLKQ